MARVIKIWDARSWTLFHDLPDLTGCVHSLAFHPKDRRILAWGSTHATVKVWDTTTKEMIRILHGHTGMVESVAFSPDGEWIASASLDGTGNTRSGGRFLVYFTCQCWKASRN
jgi:WD40 repeat protein